VQEAFHRLDQDEKGELDAERLRAAFDQYGFDQDGFYQNGLRLSAVEVQVLAFLGVGVQNNGVLG
jgi:Ca2+-binding EF-hand superfamily protein